MPDLLATVCGIAIVSTVAVDIFRSLLVPRANSRVLRVAPILTTVLFAAWQSLAERLPERAIRQTFRASFAPRPT